MKIRRLWLFVLLVELLIPGSGLASNNFWKKTDNKDSFFIYWGYNRMYFSQSDMHFYGPQYDFNLYDVNARDSPSPLSFDYINPSTLSVPQYNLRLGYFISNRVSVSLGIDHGKYIVDKNQYVPISGTISQEASDKFDGSYLNDRIQLTEDFLIFEHTNGFNLVSLDFDYLQPLAEIFDSKLKFHWNFGIGGVWMITKTNVKVMGEGLDNEFHVSGFFGSFKTGPRVEFCNRFFLLGEVKTGYVHMPVVLLQNSGDQRAAHNVSFTELYVAIGYRFRIKLKKDLNKE